MIEDPLYCDREFKKAFLRYVQYVWWPAVKADPSQYDYWRMNAKERMGKLKVIRAEGQDVLFE